MHFFTCCAFIDQYAKSQLNQRLETVFTSNENEKKRQELQSAHHCG